MVSWERRLVFVFACLGSLVAGCSGGRSPDLPDAGPMGENPDADPGDPTLVDLVVSPPTVSLGVGETRELTVTGTYSDASSQVITSGLVWETSEATVVTVSAAGVATGIASGTATLTVSISGLSATVDVTVTGGPVLGVFGDDYGADAFFAPFGGVATTPSVDATEAHSGSASLRIDVPASGYTGGTIKRNAPADLSGFEAVTFWAKASQAASLNVVGLGNDGASSAFMAEWNAVPLTTAWTRHVVPLPLASRLSAEVGLFHFAEGPEEGAYTIWLDDIQYETLPAGTLGTPSPAIATDTVTKLIGDTGLVNGTSVTWTIGGVVQSLAAARRYFTYTSSVPAVATVDELGVVSAVGEGTTTITAKLGALDALGTLTVQVMPATAPETAAPVPTVPAADVISLFSGAYTSAAVDTWLTAWSNAALAELQVAGDDVKKYSSLHYAGVEFYVTQSIDATTMTHFHIDVWTPDSTVVRLKLVDFGANGAYGGGDDTEHELSFDAASTPALVTNAWLALDVPLASFANLASRAHLSQLIISGSASTVYVDNVYFHK